MPVATQAVLTGPQQAAASSAANGTSSLQQYLSYLSSNMGRVDTAAIEQQAQQQINQQVAPSLAGLAGLQTSGDRAIAGYTGTLAHNLGAIGNTVAGDYQQAEQQQSALDAAVAAELRGNGQQQASALGAVLAQRGQDTSPAAQAAANAGNAAGATYATGSASLADLVASGAAAKSYATQLPGVARLAGLQATGAFQGDIAKQAGTILADAQKQYPSLVRDLTNTQLAEQKNQISLGLAGLADQIKQESADTAATKAANTAAYQQGQLTLGGQKVRIAAQNANTTATKAANTAAYQQGQLKVAQGRLTVAQENALTNQIKATTAAAKARKNGGLTANEHASLMSKASKLAAVYYNGIPAKQHWDASTGKWVPVPGTGQDYTPYPQALQRLVATGLSPADAASVLDAYFQEGEGGRPYSQATAKTAARGAAAAGSAVAGLGLGK